MSRTSPEYVSPSSADESSISPRFRGGRGNGGSGIASRRGTSTGSDADANIAISSLGNPTQRHGSVSTIEPETHVGASLTWWQFPSHCCCARVSDECEVRPRFAGTPAHTDAKICYFIVITTTQREQRVQPHKLATSLVQPNLLDVSYALRLETGTRRGDVRRIKTEIVLDFYNLLRQVAVNYEHSSAPTRCATKTHAVSESAASRRELRAPDKKTYLHVVFSVHPLPPLMCHAFRIISSK